MKSLTNVMGSDSGKRILNNIPRKYAIIPTGNPLSSPFTMKTPGHNTILGWEGTDYNSSFTESNVPPLSGQFSNATLPQAPALQVTAPGTVVPVGQFTKNHPSEKHVLHTNDKPRSIVHRTGGPSPTSDTPFHPGKRPPTPPNKTRPTMATISAVKRHVNSQIGSFLQNHTGQVNGAGTLSSHVHSDLPVARWDTIKRGAAG